MNNAAYKKLDYSLALLSTTEGGKISAASSTPCTRSPRPVLPNSHFL